MQIGSLSELTVFLTSMQSLRLQASSTVPPHPPLHRARLEAHPQSPQSEPHPFAHLLAASSPNPPSDFLPALHIGKRAS